MIIGSSAEPRFLHPGDISAELPAEAAKSRNTLIQPRRLAIEVAQRPAGTAALNQFRAA
jgi:hypothetical protein